MAQLVDADIQIDSVTIFNTKIERPSSMAVSQWEYFWRRAVSAIKEDASDYARRVYYTPAAGGRGGQRDYDEDVGD